MDELAHAVGEDAIAFRLKHTVDPRLARVLETVRETSGWGKPATGRHGRGVACTIYHGTYVAEVVEVSVDDDGHIRLDRVWCAVDAGRLVHPDGARNQIEGGVQQAASWTLFEELQIQDGQVTTATWRDYPIARFTDAPRTIEVTFTGDLMCHRRESASRARCRPRLQSPMPYSTPPACDIGRCRLSDTREPRRT